MLMPSKGLSLSQCDSSHTSQIAASLTFKLRLETISQSSTVTGEPFTTEVDDGTQVGFGGGGKVEIGRIDSQTAKSKIHDFC